jgi:HD-like signal output (HDOD) protein
LDEIGETISRDPPMTAKLLQWVNSAYFGLQQPIHHPSEAIAYLGFDTTKSLLLLAHTCSYFDRSTAAGISMESLWRHSSMTARAAQRISEFECRDPELAGQSFTAGLLHDVGQLLLAANLPEESRHALQRASDQGWELWQAEREVFGTHHAEIGAGLLAIWGLPNPIIEAVGLHHQPVHLASATFTPLVAVHSANVWARATDPSHTRGLAPQFDADFLLHSGCLDRIMDWEQALATRAEPVRDAVGF